MFSIYQFLKLHPMGNQLFRERLDRLIDQCLSEARECIQLNHNGMSGTVRQILVEKLLRPMLPEGVHIGTGKITDSSGNLSAETDVIIYDRRTIPPILYDDKMGVFPIESVYYAIEIKTTLNNQELIKTIGNGQKLRSLRGLQPHSAIFAFGSNLKASDDSNRIIQAQKDMPTKSQDGLFVLPPINIFCIAGREYGFWDELWKLHAHEEGDNVVARFLIGIMNTVVESTHSQRHSIQPGWYFVPGYDPPQYDLAVD